MCRDMLLVFKYYFLICKAGALLPIGRSQKRLRLALQPMFGATHYSEQELYIIF